MATAWALGLGLYPFSIHLAGRNRIGMEREIKTLGIYDAWSKESIIIIILPYPVPNPKVGIFFWSSWQSCAVTLGSKNPPCERICFWCANQSFFNLNSVLQDLWSEQFLHFFMIPVASVPTSPSRFPCSSPPSSQPLDLYVLLWSYEKPRWAALADPPPSCPPTFGSSGNPQRHLRFPPVATPQLTATTPVGPKLPGVHQDLVEFPLQNSAWKKVGLSSHMWGETSSSKWLTLAHSLALHCKYGHIVC